MQEPRSRNQIEQGVDGKAGYIRVATDRLIVEGFAEESPGPRGAKLVRLLGIYREHEEETE